MIGAARVLMATRLMAEEGTPLADMILAAEGLLFPEGPVVMADGSVVLVEIKRATLSRVRPNGAVEVLAELGGGPNGAAVGPEGAIYVCNNGGRFTWIDYEGLTVPGLPPPEHRGGSIQRVVPGTGKVETLYDCCDGRRLLAPNDLVFDRAGGFWFTDHGTASADGLQYGAICYAASDGSAIRRVGHLPTPNGIGLSPDGRVLYVADTGSGRIWACDVVAPGELGPGLLPGLPGRVVASLPGYQLVDSLAVEADGRVCVGTLFNGGISVCIPDGEVEHVLLPDPLVTNIAFGGGDMRDAWITASGTGRLYRTRWPRPGLELSYQALCP